MDSRTSLTLSTPVLCTGIAGYRLYAERDRVFNGIYAANKGLF